MAKIIFYNSDLKEKVNRFIDSLQPIDPAKETFITFDMISARTGITLQDSSPSEIIASIISIITMVNTNIFVQYESHIERNIIDYVNKNREKIDPIDFVYVNVTAWKDTVGINLADDEELEYTMLVPRTISILYLAPTVRIEEEAKQLTPTSKFVFDIPRIKAEASTEDNVRVALAFPQITSSSSVEFCKILEDAINVNPVDLIIFDHEGVDHDDILLDMIYKYNSSKSDFIPFINLDTKAYSIEEAEEEPATEVEAPPVEAEVIE